MGNFANYEKYREGKFNIRSKRERKATSILTATTREDMLEEIEDLREKGLWVQIVMNAFVVVDEIESKTKMVYGEEDYLLSMR